MKQQNKNISSALSLFLLVSIIMATLGGCFSSSNSDTSSEVEVLKENSVVERKPEVNSLLYTSHSALVNLAKSKAANSEIEAVLDGLDERTFIVLLNAGCDVMKINQESGDDHSTKSTYQLAERFPTISPSKLFREQLADSVLYASGNYANCP